MQERLQNLKNKFTENEIKVQRASDEAEAAEELADKAEKVSEENCLCYHVHIQYDYVIMILKSV